MKNLKFAVTALVMGLALAGCSVKSQTMTAPDMANPATMITPTESKEIKFPAIEKARFSTSNYKGSWPNWDNVAQVEHGMSKDQLYNLLGQPHFSEGLFGVREWNYVFNYRDQGEHKVCQYQVHFDKDMNVSAFYWSDQACEAQMQPKPNAVQQTIINNIIQQTTPPAEVEPKLVEKLVLGSDALFAFDKSGLNDIRGDGQAKLANLVHKIKATEKVGKVSVFIVGHTDRLGDESYNMNLSKQRADTVAGYLLSQGIKPASIAAFGAGELMPVTECASGTKPQLIDCLQPNRRVEIQLYVHQ